MGRKLINLIGQKFGKLTVINFAGKNKYNNFQWLCKCECGNTVIKTTAELNSKNVKSCGCLKIIFPKHNKTNTRLYNVFRGMKQRCYNPNEKTYKHYGGRGIKICQEWLDDYMSFHNWAYANGYDENAKYGECTIDRIDTNKDYSPSNCHWVNMKIQSNNKNNNHLITYNNETHTVSEWSDITGITKNTLIRRLKKNWNVKETLTTSKGLSCKYITFNNKTLSISDWARELNMQFSTLSKRLSYGWSIEKALTTPVKKTV